MKVLISYRLLGMETEIEAEIHLPKGNNGRNGSFCALRKWATRHGFPWLELKFFVPNYPERGEGLIKEIGYSEINAIG